MAYYFESANQQELAKVWQAAPSQVQSVIETWLRGVQMHMEGEVKQRTPKRDGFLQNSIAAQPLETHAMGVSAVIGVAPDAKGALGTSLNYAIPVELGTKPHEIRPKNKRALVFTIAGRQVFAGKVKHPGTKGAFMFSRAFDANVGKIQDDLNDLVRSIGMQLGVL